MVRYEWVVETLVPVNDEEIEIRDVNHWATYAEAEAFAEGLTHYDIALVRDHWAGGYLDRSWAYVLDGGLPERFEDGLRNVAVPERFHQEVARFNHAKLSLAPA